MQNNLATDIIRKLKNRIKILIVALVILSLLSAGLCFVAVRKATMCGDCKENVIKQKTGLFINRKDDCATIIQKRRARDGKAYNV